MTICYLISLKPKFSKIKPIILCSIDEHVKGLFDKALGYEFMRLNNRRCEEVMEILLNLEYTDKKVCRYLKYFKDLCNEHPSYLFTITTINDEDPLC